MRNQEFKFGAQVRPFRRAALCCFALCLLAACAGVVPPPPQALPVIPGKADHVLVLKERRTLFLMQGDTELAHFTIALGKNPVGPKRAANDMRTPEGSYLLDRHNPFSQFYRSIHISYPNTNDIAWAQKNGVSPGGNIMIHGLPKSFAEIGNYVVTDWTDGCIAVTNQEMDRIWKLVDDNTPIEIDP